VSIIARTQNRHVNVNVRTTRKDPDALSRLQMRWKHAVRRIRTKLNWTSLQMVNRQHHIELLVLDSDTVRYAAVVCVVRNIGSAALDETKHSKRERTYQYAYYKSASTAD
jgi:hypothetical protein